MYDGCEPVKGISFGDGFLSYIAYYENITTSVSMITVHHLGISQSERILWLLEELGLEYKLVKYERDPVLSPESLKSLPGNETGTSPFIEDDAADVKLSESAAICEYIIHKYGGGRLALKPDNKHFADYL